VSDTLTVLVTALTTLLVAVVAAVVAARLQAAREQAKWLRERRYEVCVALLRSIDWADLNQKVDVDRPADLAAPADLYADLEVLGLLSVRAAAAECSEALAQIHARVSKAERFDGDLYKSLQTLFDACRAAFAAEVRAALKIKVL
jgi:hypothetical protein